MVSCGKIENFLLTVPTIGKSTIESYLSDYDGYVTVGEGMHSELRQFYTTFVTYGETAGDLLNITSSASQENDLAFNYGNTAALSFGYPKSIWDDAWSTIREANNLLYYGPIVRKTGLSLEQYSVVDKIMAQAYLARALVSFNLCSCFAQPYNYTEDHSHIGIPVVTGVPAYNETFPRETVSKVYAQILSDIKSSMETFDKVIDENPTSEATGVQKYAIKDCYHLSYIAAESLMAKVCLYMEDWPNAEKYSKSVMDKVSLTQHDDYVKMFRKSQENPGAESILRMNAYNTISSISQLYDPTKSCQLYPVPGFENYYDIDDVRKTLLTYVPEDCESDEFKGKTYPAVCKFLYLKSIDAELKKVADVFVFRVSEMYLIHAEAVLNSRADIETAKDDLASLIARAKGRDKSQVTLEVSSVKQAKDLVSRERIRELCFEGHRLFDITRRKEDLVRSKNSNSKIKKISYPDYRFILPIYQKEMEGNVKMTQNEGY